MKHELTDPSLSFRTYLYSNTAPGGRVTVPVQVGYVAAESDIYDARCSYHRRNISNRRPHLSQRDELTALDVSHSLNSAELPTRKIFSPKTVCASTSNTISVFAPSPRLLVKEAGPTCNASAERGGIIAESR
jgi:hypothetical protein